MSFINANGSYRVKHQTLAFGTLNVHAKSVCESKIEAICCGKPLIEKKPKEKE